MLEVPAAWFGKTIEDEEKESSGVSGSIVKLAGLELPPPGVGLLTVTEALPLCARSVAGTNAVNAVLAVYVVGRALPFHITTEPAVKPCPLIVSWKTELPCGNDDGVREATCGTGFEATDAAILLVNTKTAPLFPATFCARKANPFVPQRIRLFAEVTEN